MLDAKALPPGSTERCTFHNNDYPYSAHISRLAVVEVHAPARVLLCESCALNLAAMLKAQVERHDSLKA